ncbi:MAG: HdeD family acid-resistance protein [Clostridium sp.]
MKFFCIIEGILLAIVGFIFLLNPFSSILSFTLFIGIIFVVYGIIKFFRLWKDEHKILHIFMCVIDVLFGLILMFTPINAIASLILLFGVWAVVRGIYALIYSAKVHTFGFNFPTVYSVIIIIWGIFIIAYPITGLVLLSIIPFILGIYFIVIAISEIYLAFKL